MSFTSARKGAGAAACAASCAVRSSSSVYAASVTSSKRQVFAARSTSTARSTARRSPSLPRTRARNSCSFIPLFPLNRRALPAKIPPPPLRAAPCARSLPFLKMTQFSRPPAMPRSQSFASPGPFTAQPMTAIFLRTFAPKARRSTSCARRMLSHSHLPQVGQEMTSANSFSSPHARRMRFAAYTSSTGSSVSETRIVSPDPAQQQCAESRRRF